MQLIQQSHPVVDFSQWPQGCPFRVRLAWPGSISLRPNGPCSKGILFIHATYFEGWLPDVAGALFLMHPSKVEAFLASGYGRFYEPRRPDDAIQGYPEELTLTHG